jgi:uncharacterized protein (DUF2237 family)
MVSQIFQTKFNNFQHGMLASTYSMLIFRTHQKSLGYQLSHNIRDNLFNLLLNDKKLICVHRWKNAGFLI